MNIFLDITYTLFHFFVIYFKICRVALQLFSKVYIENGSNKPGVTLLNFHLHNIAINDGTTYSTELK